MNEGNFVEHNHETEHTWEINMFQLEVGMEWDRDIPDSNQKFEQWTAIYSPRFRRILDEELDADAQFWDHFQDPEFRQALKDRIKSKLYANEEKLEEAA